LGEAYFLDFIKFREGDLVVDCRTHTGDKLLYFSDQYLAINYVDFEPDLEAFRCLSHNARGYSEIHNIFYGTKRMNLLSMSVVIRLTHQLLGLRVTLKS